VAASIVVFSLLLGIGVSVIIGLGYEGFILISPTVTIIDSLLLGLAIVISLYFTRYLAEKTRNAMLVLALSFGLMLGAGIVSFVGFFLSNPASFLYPGNRITTFLLINLLFFITLNIITSGFVVFQQTILDKEKALNEEKVLKTRAELRFLTAKINPHFLFNSLNLLISQLKSPEKAEETLINLSELLRYQLDISDAKTVSLDTELDIVKKYLTIQKLRFGEKLSFQIDQQTSGEIPPLIVQPLVENSIKHNIDLTDHLVITIKATKDKQRMVISVMDSMSSMHDGMVEKGIGLTVTKKRIEHVGGSFLIKNGGIEISFHAD
jgi:sensor histidine kinase YesM